MKYTNPKLTVDGVIIEERKILLIKRKREPFKNKWSLPGGYVEYKVILCIKIYKCLLF